jgi:prefoldin subunit 5
LRIAAGSEASIVPAVMEHGADIGHVAPLICQLQAGQLKDAVVEFDNDIGQISRSLNTLFRDATGVVGHGRSLYVSQDGTTSFLAAMKQTLAQAAVLIGTCETARKTVDEALSVLEGTLGKFRHAISELSETVVDIILIGMNASLKAGHLGTRGSAFVVIANELKATADRISDGAKLLKPVLDSIERSAGELRKLRVDEDPSQLATLEPSVLHAIQEIEAGNGRLGQLIELLGREGAQFENSMTAAQAVLTALSDASATLPFVATRLEAVGAGTEQVSSVHGRKVQQLFDDLAAQYTMESERDVHARFSQRCGLTYTLTAHRSRQDQGDDVLFF